MWCREDYISKAMQQQSTCAYTEISTSVVHYSTMKTKLRRLLENDELNRITVNNPIPGRFYMLHKIHQNFNPYPGRPITSNCALVAEKISRFLDNEFKLLLIYVKSLISSTSNSLKRLNDEKRNYHLIL
ncbi:hypothetical protein GJ496_001497 [Pomphorhynchus laevis]|nr:hypothetical protein GJ496_001497 [Pomphorhynchus laevis]